MHIFVSLSCNYDDQLQAVLKCLELPAAHLALEKERETLELQLDITHSWSLLISLLTFFFENVCAEKDGDVLALLDGGVGVAGGCGHPSRAHATLCQVRETVNSLLAAANRERITAFFHHLHQEVSVQCMYMYTT